MATLSWTPCAPQSALAELSRAGVAVARSSISVSPEGVASVQLDRVTAIRVALELNLHRECGATVSGSAEPRPVVAPKPVESKPAPRVIAPGSPRQPSLPLRFRKGRETTWSVCQRVHERRPGLAQSEFYDAVIAEGATATWNAVRNYWRCLRRRARSSSGPVAS